MKFEKGELEMRLKLELEAEELNEAVDFFTHLFEQSPDLRTAASAEFSVPGPELNLVLSQADSTPTSKATPTPGSVPEACC